MAVKEPGKKTAKLQDTLNEQLANWWVMYVKLHHFHWYVKGPHFPVLHVKFEELYEMAAKKLDELAERMLAIGLEPSSTMKEYLSVSHIKEGGKAGADDTDILETIVDDFAKMVDGLKKATQIAEEEFEDTATADMLNEHIEDLQKQMWMLNATIGK
ncbi:DNA starvation/stationary phase protection protein [Cohnella pontilimi]|uniref:DNA starvation/stationary phase protection protein n=2 Tax=Cohnella pontilimi TaxID=2564100 RepID=A0A4U0FB22_9BACL|nr:DNA starvation/stationary phase protection protein [Cohnella pontilimi]